MTFDPHDFMIRRPRHCAADGGSGCVWLKPATESVPEPQKVQLLDFSRRGAKIELKNPVSPNSDVLLHVVDEAMGLSIEIPGRVRWQRTDGVGRWLLGCHFEELVSYEVIGEMFLSGVLSTGAHST